jgi:hypothetical protein
MQSGNHCTDVQRPALKHYVHTFSIFFILQEAARHKPCYRRPSFLYCGVDSPSLGMTAHFSNFMFPIPCSLCILLHRQIHVLYKMHSWAIIKRFLHVSAPRCQHHGGPFSTKECRSNTPIQLLCPFTEMIIIVSFALNWALMMASRRWNMQEYFYNRSRIHFIQCMNWWMWYTCIFRSTCTTERPTVKHTQKQKQTLHNSTCQAYR